MKQIVYLDNAATTPIDAEVLDWMHQQNASFYGNPSSFHQLGREAKVLVESARTTIAKYLKVLPAEIFFTSGGTESINTLVKSLVEKDEICQLITSPIEHPAMLRSLEYYCNKLSKPLIYIEVDRMGQVNLEMLEQVLKQANGSSLVSLMHANNELGTLLSIQKVADLTQKYHSFFLSDTVQTMGKLPNDTFGEYVDFAVGSAHKFHGPKGTSFLYINSKNKISPLLLGGSQERNMRAGTENVIAISAMAKAFEIANKEMESTNSHIQNLRTYLLNRLRLEFPAVQLNGDPQGLPAILNLGIPKTTNNELLLMKFDIHGIMVSGGSACSSGAMKDSHVIIAIGINDEIRPIRLSMSKLTQQSDLDAFFEVLKKYE
jgi:cysteine desulfurase